MLVIKSCNTEWKIPVSEPPGAPNLRVNINDVQLRIDLVERLTSGENLTQILQDVVDYYEMEVLMNGRTKGSEAKTHVPIETFYLITDILNL